MIAEKIKKKYDLAMFDYSKLYYVSDVITEKGKSVSGSRLAGH